MPVSKIVPFSTINMLYKSPKIAETKASSTVDATDPCTSRAPSDNTSVIRLTSEFCTLYYSLRLTQNYSKYSKFPVTWQKEYYIKWQ